MTQQLINTTHITQQTVQFKNIKATFTEIKSEILDKVYEVILEISSHKFFISIQEIAGKIEKFEILASKWFMELTQKSIITIKNLTEHMYYRLG